MTTKPSFVTTQDGMIFHPDLNPENHGHGARPMPLSPAAIAWIKAASANQNHTSGPWGFPTFNNVQSAPLNADAVAWIRAASGGGGSHPSPVSQTGGGSVAAPAMGGGGGGASHDQFDAAAAHINQMFDQQLSQLHQQHGVAESGVNQAGVDLQSALGGLASDATGQSAQIGKQIGGTYKNAKSEDAATYKSLLADLQRQGAQTQGLAAEAKSRNAALGDQQARQGSLQARLGSLLQSSLNDRRALGAQNKTDQLGELQRVLASGEATAGQGHSNALFQNEQARATAQAQMALEMMKLQAAAAARSSRGGGGSSKQQSTPLSAVTALLKASGGKGSKLDFDKAAKALGYDFQKLQGDPNTKDEAFQVQETLNHYADGQSTAQQLANFNRYVNETGANKLKYDPNDINYLINGLARAQKNAAPTGGINQDEALQLFGALNGRRF